MVWFRRTNYLHGKKFVASNAVASPNFGEASALAPDGLEEKIVYKVKQLCFLYAELSKKVG